MPAQVQDNVIMQNDAEGILLGSNTYTPNPYAWPENVNVSFINNLVMGSQFDPFTIMSAGNVLVMNNR
jgi:hypothetical protein